MSKGNGSMKSHKSVLPALVYLFTIFRRILFSFSAILQRSLKIMYADPMTLCQILAQNALSQSNCKII